MKRGQWIAIILIAVLVVLGVLAYAWVARPDWGRSGLAWWYGLQTPKQAAGEYPTIVAVGVPGGSDLGEYGLKLAYIDGVRVERVWRWGGSDAHYWMVLSYELNGKSGWLIVPVKGRVSLRESGGEAQTIEPQTLAKTLSRGERVQLTLLHRFDDKIPAQAAREELTNRRVRLGGRDRQVAETEIGQFPGRAWSNEEVKAMLSGGVVQLDEEQFLLLGIKGL